MFSLYSNILCLCLWQAWTSKLYFIPEKTRMFTSSSAETNKLIQFSALCVACLFLPKSVCNVSLCDIFRMYCQVSVNRHDKKLSKSVSKSQTIHCSMFWPFSCTDILWQEGNPLWLTVVVLYSRSSLTHALLSKMLCVFICWFASQDAMDILVCAKQVKNFKYQIWMNMQKCILNILFSPLFVLFNSSLSLTTSRRKLNIWCNFTYFDYKLVCKTTGKQESFFSTQSSTSINSQHYHFPFFWTVSDNGFFFSIEKKHSFVLMEIV